MGVNDSLYVGVYHVFFPPVLRRPSTICKQIFFFPSCRVSGKSDTHFRTLPRQSCAFPT